MGVPCGNSLIPSIFHRDKQRHHITMCQRKNAIFSQLKGGVPNSQQFVCMTSSLLPGVLCHMSTPFDYHVQVPNNMKSQDKSHLRKGLPSDSSSIPTISHRDTQCQHVPNEGCHFLSTKEGPPTMCETECLFTLTRDAFVICQHPLVICVHTKHSLQQNMVFPTAIGLDKCEISYVISSISM